MLIVIPKLAGLPQAGNHPRGMRGFHVDPCSDQVKPHFSMLRANAPPQISGFCQGSHLSQRLMRIDRGEPADEFPVQW